MMGPFLMLLGAFLLFVASQGKSAPFLHSIGIDFDAYQHDVDNAVTQWAKRNIWDPLGKTIKDNLPALLKIGS